MTTIESKWQQWTVELVSRRELPLCVYVDPEARLIRIAKGTPGNMAKRFATAVSLAMTVGGPRRR